MSRNINIGGHKETFSDKYLKVYTIVKSGLSLPGATTNTVDFTTELANAGVSLSDIVAQEITAMNCRQTWGTRPEYVSNHSAGKFNVYTNGSTTQGYDFTALFFVKVIAVDSY